MNGLQKSADDWRINNVSFTPDGPDYEEAFIAGAKYAALPVQRLGEIIQQYAPSLPRNVVEELRVIFEATKEIVDE